MWYYIASKRNIASTFVVLSATSRIILLFSYTEFEDILLKCLKPNRTSREHSNCMVNNVKQQVSELVAKREAIEEGGK